MTIKASSTESIGAAKPVWGTEQWKCPFCHCDETKQTAKQLAVIVMPHGTMNGSINVLTCFYVLIHPNSPNKVVQHSSHGKSRMMINVVWRLNDGVLTVIPFKSSGNMALTM